MTNIYQTGVERVVIGLLINTNDPITSAGCRLSAVFDLHDEHATFSPISHLTVFFMRIHLLIKHCCLYYFPLLSSGQCNTKKGIKGELDGSVLPSDTKKDNIVVALPTSTCSRSLATCRHSRKCFERECFIAYE